MISFATPAALGVTCPLANTGRLARLKRFAILPFAHLSASLFRPPDALRRFAPVPGEGQGNAVEYSGQNGDLRRLLPSHRHFVPLCHLPQRRRPRRTQDCAVGADIIRPPVHANFICIVGVRVSGGYLCRRQKHRPSRQARPFTDYI